LTRPNEIFFDPGEKIQKFRILGKIFQTQTQTKDDWPGPELQKIDMAGVKNF